MWISQKSVGLNIKLLGLREIVWRYHHFVRYNNDNKNIGDLNEEVTRKQTSGRTEDILYRLLLKEVIIHQATVILTDHEENREDNRKFWAQTNCMHFYPVRIMSQKK